jgi:hypothetical protein
VVITGIAVGIVIVPQVLANQEKKSETITISTLEKIIDKSDLSTFQAVYNGIAKVMNEEKPEQTDYHVSYEAKVKAGFDLKQVKIHMSEEAKTIKVEIPEIVINDVTVDIASLDYMFMDDKKNNSTVSAQAYRACIDDVTNESKQESAIFELAELNAENIMKALLNPFVEEMDGEYEIAVVFGGM